MNMKSNGTGAPDKIPHAGTLARWHAGTLARWINRISVITLLSISFAFFNAPAFADTVAPTLSYSPSTTATVFTINGCTGDPCVLQNYTCSSLDACYQTKQTSPAGWCTIFNPAANVFISVGYGSYPTGYTLCYIGTNWLSSAGDTYVGLMAGVTAQDAPACASGGTLVNNKTQCAICSDGSKPSGTYPNMTCSRCSVDPLPKPPPFTGDNCSQELEDNGGQLPDPSVCQNFDQDKNNHVAQCVQDKIKALGISYSGPTATYRTVAYQNHLWQLWNKSLEISAKYRNSGVQFIQDCPDVVMNVLNEMKHHGLKSAPTPGADSHSESRAIDISGKVVKALADKLKASYTVTTVRVINGRKVKKSTSMNIETYLNSTTVNPSTRCDPINYPIQWGGNFTNSPRDPVHFQLSQ